MNPYQIPVTCSVCGGKGMARPELDVHPWFATYKHQDSRICAANLESMRREKEQLEKKMAKIKEAIEDG